MRRVLIAEDEPDIQDVLRQALTERLDVDVDAVANGALVMDWITARRPDLLILDVQLPGLNGLDVFDLLRSDQHWQGVPVSFSPASLTARSRRTHRPECMRSSRSPSTWTSSSRARTG